MRTQKPQALFCLWIVQTCIDSYIMFSSGDSSKFFLHFLLREAARECRRKKKEYVKCLENRVAVLENQNKTLIEELKALKDIYCHKAE